MILRLLPVLLSSLLLAAHFSRAGRPILVLLALAAPFVLLVQRPWAARAIQVWLALAAMEWVRTLVGLARRRISAGEPWLRMAVILAVVAAATLASAAVFRLRPLRDRYSL